MSASAELPNRNTDAKANSRTRPSKDSRLGYLLSTWARQSYDELGKLVLLNGILFAATALVFTPTYFLAGLMDEGTPFFPAGVLLILLGAFDLWVVLWIWFLVNAYLEKIFTFQYPGFREAFSDCGRRAVTSLGTLAFLGGTTGILAFNLWTYPAMLSNSPFLRFLALGVTLWVGLFLALVQVHLIPFLVHQDRPFFTALRRAAKVAVWKPFWTLTILLIQMLFAALYLIPPFFLIVPSLYAALSNLSLLILLEDWKDPYEKTPEAIRAGA